MKTMAAIGECTIQAQLGPSAQGDLVALGRLMTQPLLSQPAQRFPTPELDNINQIPPG